MTAPARLPRQRVTRADGRIINVVRKRGHLTYCVHGCCCGRVDKGYAPAPVDTYKEEWLRCKMRHQVHLTKGGCLGPCTLNNVAHLVFDGHDVWFHSVNDPWLVVAIFDYIPAMLEKGYVPPPPELLEYTFHYYAWDAAATAPAPQLGLSAAPLPELSGMALLSHADTDLLNLRAAREALPDGFGTVTGALLGSIRSEEQMSTLLSGEVGRAQVVIARIHGPFAAVTGGEMLREHARLSGQTLIIVSGTNEPNSELARLSYAPAPLLETARAYLAASGWQNTRELLLSLSDTLRLTGYGAAPPLMLPEHGIYHPQLPEAATLADWERLREPQRPADFVLPRPRPERQHRLYRRPNRSPRHRGRRRAAHLYHLAQRCGRRRQPARLWAAARCLAHRRAGFYPVFRDGRRHSRRHYGGGRERERLRALRRAGGAGAYPQQRKRPLGDQRAV